MSETWANRLELHLDVSGTRVRSRLEAALRDAIRSGRLAEGARLPSSRTLAADLGIARNTVAEVYTQLTAEGWLTARGGSGTTVAPLPRRRRSPTPPTRCSATGDPRGLPALRGALAEYLTRTRGVVTTPGGENVVICSGFAHGVEVVSRALRAAGAGAVAVEEYGHPGHRDIITRQGLRAPLLPLDAAPRRRRGRAPPTSSRSA